MRLRRLNAPPIVVLTGVENAGKTTLAQQLAARLGWALLPEAARTDAAVVAGSYGPQDLQRLLTVFQHNITSHTGQATPGLLCDTGALTLEIWSRTVFGTHLKGWESAMAMADLHILCHTLPDWEPDPLRTLPKLKDRRALQAQYKETLEMSGVPFAEVETAEPTERLAAAEGLIRNMRFE